MFRTKEKVLALDLGTSCLKAVELEAAGGASEEGAAAIRSVASLELPAPPDGDREGRPDHRARLISALGDLLRGMGIQPKKVRRLVTSLPGSQVSIKQIRCPALPDAEIRSALVFEARKHLPVEGEVLMDFQILARRPEDLDILLVVTTKQAVVQHLALLEAVGLKGGVIEAPPLALWNAWLGGPGAPGAGKGNGKVTGEGDEPMGFLNIGAASTTLSFWQPGGLFLSREIPIAGDRFTADGRERSGKDFPEAEREKVARGLFGAGAGNGEGAAQAAGGLSLELEGENQGQHPSLQSLAREIQRSVRFYLKESGRPRVAGLVLAGGSACGAGLDEWLARELGLPVRYFDPLAGLEDRSEGLPANRRQFAQAMGMALRGAHEFFPR